MLPAAAAVPIVVSVAICVAESDRLPMPLSVVPPAATSASVRSLAIVSATPGVTAMPPAAPTLAVVLAPNTPLAVTTLLAAPMSAVPPISAVERLPVTVSAKAAPMPNFEAPPDWFGAADVVAAARPSEAIVRVPEPSWALPPLAKVAVLAPSTRFTATAPATPTLVAPAPEMALTP